MFAINDLYINQVVTIPPLSLPLSLSDTQSGTSPAYTHTNRYYIIYIYKTYSFELINVESFIHKSPTKTIPKQIPINLIQ